jgi:flagellar P-ring protein FlgI
MMRFIIHSLIIIYLTVAATSSYGARIKDITAIEGVRDNQLIGYGLVVGLDGTGDRTSQAPFTTQSFQNMLLDFGIRIPSSSSSQLKNVAAVAVSATLPPFSRNGQKIDVTILSLGNATSLRGGSLLMTPLRGADGKVYAVAQGSVVVSGFGAQGQDGSKVTVNVTSSGTIPNGALVENTIDTPFVKNGAISFDLMQPDFTTAERIEKAINRGLGSNAAKAMDASVVVVRVGSVSPAAYMYKGDVENDDIDRSKYVPLISKIQNLELDPAELSAKVIVNSRTGTIVIGHNVTLAPVAVSHGNLSVIISEREFVSQPNALAAGKTVKGKASDININQQQGRAFVFAPGPSLNDVVQAINSVGAAPGDLIAILEAIKAAGALNADLQVI